METHAASPPALSPLRRWRIAKGMTLEEFGKHIGLSKSRLSEIENGSSCTLDTALAIETFTAGAVRPSDLRSGPSA